MGGIQSRITKAFYNNDAEKSNTKALDAVWDVYNRGGEVSGSSAGAAIMSKVMIVGSSGTVMDGASYNYLNNGVLLSKGLGFFKGGIVDQHFSKRGRIGRLAVSLIDGGVPYGFGIDENSAMVVNNSGEVEVIGESGMFVINASSAKKTNGAYEGLHVSYIEKGDKYNFVTKAYTIHSSKSKIAAGQEQYNSYPRIDNIFASDAAKFALTKGLVDNTAIQQIGYSSEDAAELIFKENPTTLGYRGTGYAALNIDFGIYPWQSQ